MKKLLVLVGFQDNLNEKGEVDKFKAKLVAKGFIQTQGVDFCEVWNQNIIKHIHLNIVWPNI